MAPAGDPNKSESDEASIIETRDRCAPRSDVLALTGEARGCGGLLVGGSVIRQVAYPTEVVARFGAGDALVAGLLWVRLRGTPVRALQAANGTTAPKCRIAGDPLAVTADELEDFLVDRPGETPPPVKPHTLSTMRTPKEST